MVKTWHCCFSYISSSMYSVSGGWKNDYLIRSSTCHHALTWCWYQRIQSHLALDNNINLHFGIRRSSLQYHSHDRCASSAGNIETHVCSAHDSVVDFFEVHRLSYTPGNVSTLLHAHTSRSKSSIFIDLLHHLWCLPQTMQRHPKGNALGINTLQLGCNFHNAQLLVRHGIPQRWAVREGRGKEEMAIKAAMVITSVMIMATLWRDDSIGWMLWTKGCSWRVMEGSSTQMKGRCNDEVEGEKKHRDVKDWGTTLIQTG